MQTKPIFVLIRGMLRESRHWGEFIETLQQRFPTADILTPEVPGNGRLNQRTSPETITALCDEIRDQVIYKYKQQLNLIAISMGAMVAIEWMSRYPDEIASAVLINTSAKPLSPCYQRLRWQTYPTIIKMLCQTQHGREKDILKLTSNHRGSDIDLLRTWWDWQRQYPVSKISARNQLLAAARFTLPKQPPHPLLIVASKADRLVDYRCSLRLHQAWHSELRQHETAGHDLPLDDANWLAREIKEWYDKIE